MRNIHKEKTMTLHEFKCYQNWRKSWHDHIQSIANEGPISPVDAFGFIDDIISEYESEEWNKPEWDYENEE